MHPTKALLLETAVDLIDEFGPQGFTVDTLLDTSGISKGSMYHHFEDFTDVIESAEVARFARSVDADVRAITSLLREVNSRDELIARFGEILRASRGTARAASRRDRAMIIGMTRYSDQFAKALAVEQQRVTDALADIVREFQERGFVRRMHAPRTIAVYLQAYSFGRVLDDVAEVSIGDAEWEAIIEAALSGVI